jgi:prepilin-type N-terminal cleavage/methylation domain-containing protein
MRSLSDKGFTLLELILVLFIAGVALSLVAGVVGKSRGKALLRQEASDLRNYLRHARERSLMERMPYIVALDPEAGTYWIEKDGEPAGKRRNLPEGIGISGSDIVFLPKGNSTGGEITLKDTRERGYIVAVDPVTGQSTVSGLQSP